MEDLVVQDVDAVVTAKLDQRVVPIAGEDCAGGVVGEVDREQASVRPNRGRNPIDVEGPAFGGVEWVPGRFADREREGLVALVVRSDDDRMAVTIEDDVVGGEDALARPGESEDLLRGDAVVGGSDRLTNFRDPLHSSSGICIVAGMTARELALDAVGEPNRRRLLDLLREHGESTVTELVEASGLRQPQVSKHLKTLFGADLVSVRPDGRRRLYRLDATGLRAAHDWFASFEDVWQQRFDALDALVSSEPHTEQPSQFKEST